jgi:hypothetical protein
MITERPCRACGGALESVLDLGPLRLSAFPTAADAAEPPVPLDLCQCGACRLVQLRHTVDPDQLFRQYWYRSGINETMRAELADVVAAGIQAVGGLQAGDVVLDVGANDGTLLAEYRRQAPEVRVRRIAYEPADNLRDALTAHCERLVPTYYPAQAAHWRGDVRILTSIACFYDLDDPHAFVAAVADTLTPDGVWIVQFQDLWQMLRATAFDNIVHEHLVYYALASFERLIEAHGLRVVSASRRAINGGSYRLIVRRSAYDATDGSVVALRLLEQGCEHWETLHRFAWRVGEAQREIRAALGAAYRAGQAIDLYGASTKGNTLLQYCGIGPEWLRQAWERSPEKWGRQTVTGIPIVSEIAGRTHPPDLLLCGIWQFREAVLAREADYLRQGGRLLFPLPVVDLVGDRGED